MRVHQDNRVLHVTRWLVYLIMALTVFAGVVVVAVAAILPFNWAEASAEILKERPTADTTALFPILYVIFAFGIMVLGLVWAIMRKLLAIIDSVALGDPFILTNAMRLKAIGWLMVAAQIVGIRWPSPRGRRPICSAKTMWTMTCR